ncbi:MAG: YqgE/AlgH family protein [Sphingobacteriia bacterium]|nr:YqgE/AlgH family protein [Sphingobacteriia bacterium]
MKPTQRDPHARSSSEANQDPLRPGDLLLADPFMSDPSFERSVVLVLHTDLEGHDGLGLVLNRRLPGELPGSPFRSGGPVEIETWFALELRNLLSPRVELRFTQLGDDRALEVYRGEQVSECSTHAFRAYFRGYAGWSPGQLQEEISQKAWVLCRCGFDWISSMDHDDLWSSLLIGMGGEYAAMARYPRHPNLN